MSRRSWLLTTELTGVERRVKIILYDTVEEMREAAGNWKFDSDGHEHYADALGITHTFYPKRFKNPAKKSPPHCAVMRLAREHTGLTIVSHEVVHLAQYLYGLDMLEGTSKKVKRHMDGSNESFAYLYSGLLETISTILKDA